MSFTLQTPEALLARSDSRNPAITCKGRTQTGAPCRRPIACLTEAHRRASRRASEPFSSSSPLGQENGEIAMVPDHMDYNASLCDVRFYCFWHKDQAHAMLMKMQRAKVVPLKKRGSLDSLMQRLDLRDSECGSILDQPLRSDAGRGGSVGVGADGDALHEPSLNINLTKKRQPAAQPRLERSIEENRHAENKHPNYARHTDMPSGNIRRPERSPDYVSSTEFSYYTVQDQDRRRQQRQPQQQERTQRQRKGQNTQQSNRPGLFVLVCCLGARNHHAQDDHVEVVRHRKRVAPSSMQAKEVRTQQQMVPDRRRSQQPSEESKGGDAVHWRQARHQWPQQGRQQAPGGDERDSLPLHPRFEAEKAARARARATEAVAQSLEAVIAPDLPNQIKARLRATLSQPISEADEPGFIYVYWLKDQQSNSIDRDLSLLNEVYSTRASRTLPPSARLWNQAADGEVVAAELESRAVSAQPRPSQQQSPQQSPRKILVKIGRAKNVHSRLVKWSQRCGYDPSLVRTYPYVPTTETEGPLGQQQQQQHGQPRGGVVGTGLDAAAGGRLEAENQASITRKMVPFSHRVETLIHIELAGQQVKHETACAACGSKHREWFQVNATRAGLKGLDELIKKWIAWADRLEATTNNNDNNHSSQASKATVSKQYRQQAQQASPPSTLAARLMV